jgi:hypothetical protein
MEVKVDKDKKENYPVFLDGESVGGKVNYERDGSDRGWND